MPTMMTASVASSRATLPVNIVTMFCSTPSMFAVCASAGSAKAMLRTAPMQKRAADFLRGEIMIWFRLAVQPDQPGPRC